MLESIYKTKQKRDYISNPYIYDDTSTTSPNYFNIFHVPATFTAGKNIIKLGADGEYLSKDTEIDLEILDVNGQPIYNEYTGFIDRYGYHYYTVYVYDYTPPGIGSITFVGVTNRTPKGVYYENHGYEHETQYNVKWTTSVDIKATDRNLSDIIFQKAPEVVVTQVLTPYKFNLSTYALNSNLYTQSLQNLIIHTSDNAGYDFAFNQSIDVLDKQSVDNYYNYFLDSLTANTVQTNIRYYDNDIQGGFIYSEYRRYNTVVYDSLGRFSKDMEGSIFSLTNDDNGTSMSTLWKYIPNVLSTTFEIYPSKSLVDQLNAYKPKIVTVYNNQYALLSNAPKIAITDKSLPEQPVVRDLVITRLENVTGSFIYPTSSLREIHSQNLSSSYIQFTFMDFKPISGDVYRIKTYAKEAGRNTEYYQLNDHIVNTPEFLADPDKQNQAAYAKNKSDFFVYGEFTDNTIATDYWRGFMMLSESLYQYTYNLSSSAILSNYPLANSLILTNSGSYKNGVTTRYYQTYMPDEPYTLSFYCALDDGCELEVYMGSTPLKDTALGLQAPRAFIQSQNATAGEGYSKLGRYLGKVSNTANGGRKIYENVVFDFYPDADGFGRPVFLLKSQGSSVKYGYISSVSITPLDLTGYTPSILQFAAATPDSINILQDDDASLSQSLDIKIEYFTADGKQSEYTTYIPNLQINMINETPGFCTSEATRFNDQCPFYYEVSTSSSIKQTTGIITNDPTLYSAKYFWPTFSLNDWGGYYWNINSFQITGSTYNTLKYVRPASSSITSSWIRHDVILPQYSNYIPFSGSFTTMYSASAAPVTYSAAPIDGNIASNLSTDRRFYQVNGAAIDKYLLAYSQSVLLYESNSYTIQSDTTKLQKFQFYLRTSRLHFPSTNDKYLYGFHENGGIYNVRFKLSYVPNNFYRTIGGFNVTLNYPDNGTVITSSPGSEVAGPGYTKTSTRDKYRPDTGAKLMVYIADVTTPLSQLEFVPGRGGFFPPKNNIVTIGNGYSTTPTITYYDMGTGYNVDTYDIVLVQYGEKAQLVFDASGLEFELDTNPSAVPGSYKIYNNTSQAFWGGIVSDIEWCKIGITTDSRFVKPVNFENAFNTFVPYNPPVPPRPPVVPGSSGVPDTNQPSA